MPKTKEDDVQDGVLVVEGEGVVAGTGTDLWANQNKWNDKYYTTKYGSETKGEPDKVKILRMFKFLSKQADKHIPLSKEPVWEITQGL